MARMLDAGIAISAHNVDSRASLTSDADCSTRWPGEITISTTVADCGAATESVAVIAALAGQARNGRIREPAEPKHLPSFRQRNAGLPGFGLAGFENA